MGVSSTSKRISFIRAQTGFTREDIRLILDADQTWEINRLMAGKDIIRGKLYHVKPVQMPKRYRYDINTDSHGYASPHYKLKITPLGIGKECLEYLNGGVVNG